MNSQEFQYSDYSPAEFEQFRTAVQKDGFAVTQNTIDTVMGHIGSLTYLTGFYNRNQRVLTVTVKTSPWQSFQDVDLKSNVNRVVARAAGVSETAKVNPTPVKTAPVATPLGTNKNIVQPPTPVPAKVPEPLKVETPVVDKPAEVAKPAPVATPAQAPVPAQTPKPAQAAPATPTESK